MQFTPGKPATYTVLVGHLAMLDTPAEAQYRTPYGTTPCFQVVMPHSTKGAPAKLHNLMGQLKSDGLSVRGHLCGSTSSVLVREVR